ncbi:MAG: molybdopterin-dependent oxidoreductase, partial [Isosphaeraceae bacterium]
GRYGFKAANDPGLLAAMYVRQNNDLEPASVADASAAIDRSFKEIIGRGGVVAGVLSPFLTVEEAYLLARYLKGLGPASVLALGPVPTKGQDVTFRPDQSKGRTGDTSFVISRPFTIRAEKAPNRKGVEAILEHFQGSVITFDELSRRVAAKEIQGLYITGEAPEPWIDEPSSRGLRDGVSFLVVQDTTVTPLAQLADVVLAGATFAEKAGCYVNADGRLQYSGAALPPRDGSLPDLDLLAILLDRAGGPIRSAEVLAELAESVPAFAVARGGKVPPLGAVLGSTAPADGARALAFVDAWYAPMRAGRGRQTAAKE